MSGPENLLVDLALDSPPRLPPVASVAGPTFALEELAARKLVALFDRAEARDFLDVYALAHHFTKAQLI
ncbi:MAG: nucleotidyl transferase AbiEii/AbiGii toxin family protein, partial [Pseudonocardiaceae bacterium]